MRKGPFMQVIGIRMLITAFIPDLNRPQIFMMVMIFQDLILLNFGRVISDHDFRLNSMTICGPFFQRVLNLASQNERSSHPNASRFFL